MTNFITMYDATNVANIPNKALYIAGYVGGIWTTYPLLQKQFPKATLLSIAINVSENAQCLDVETGDATIADVYYWLNRQTSLKVYRPVIYIEVSKLDLLMLTMNANGFSRSQYRLWTAHYGQGEHICGPATCKETKTAADGTQWTKTANGINLDQSVLLPNFFTVPEPAAKAK